MSAKRQLNVSQMSAKCQLKFYIFTDCLIVANYLSWDNEGSGNLKI